LDNYTVFDLETTGLDPEKDRVVEIAWVLVVDREAQPVKSYVVRDGEGVVVPPEATAIHGINQGMVDESRPISEVLEAFDADSRGLPIVGHNVLRFDRNFLLNAVRRSMNGRMEFRFEKNRFIDTAALFKARKLGITPRSGEPHHVFAARILDMRVPGLRFNVRSCCVELGINLDGIELHRAGYDVAATQKIYAALTGH